MVTWWRDSGQRAEERIDAGVIASCPPGSGIVTRSLFVEPFLAYLPRGHRAAKSRHLDVKALHIEEILLLAEGHCLRDQVIEQCGGGGAPVSAPGRLNFAGGNLETLRALVEEGCGMTLLPKLSTEGLKARKGALLRSFRDPGPRRTVYLARHRALLKARSADAFAAALLRRLPAAIARSGS